jgi:hypothetical protein
MNLAHPLIPADFDREFKAAIATAVAVLGEDAASPATSGAVHDDDGTALDDDGLVLNSDSANDAFWSLGRQIENVLKTIRRESPQIQAAARAEAVAFLARMSKFVTVNSAGDCPLDDPLGTDRSVGRIVSSQCPRAFGDERKGDSRPSQCRRKRSSHVSLPSRHS